MPPIQVAYPRVGTPPNKLLARCPRLQALATRKFSEAEVVAAWNADSRQYRSCADSKDALVAWYQRRDARLGGRASKPAVRRRLKSSTI